MWRISRFCPFQEFHFLWFSVTKPVAKFYGKTLRHQNKEKFHGHNFAATLAVYYTDTLIAVRVIWYSGPVAAGQNNSPKEKFDFDIQTFRNSFNEWKSENKKYFV